MINRDEKIKALRAGRVINPPPVPPNFRIRRLLNPWRMGCDPEAALFSRTDGKYYHAHPLGLQTTGCFGCDGSGRQVEFRAFPSRSALRLVISLHAAMQSVLSYIDDPYLGIHARPSWHDDGFGGHVHFGRALAATDGGVLDLMHTTLLKSGWQDPLGYQQRLSSSRGARVPYGTKSDIRTKSYGFEYRTPCTWLQTPYIAFVVLTALKLALADADFPNIYTRTRASYTNEAAWLTAYLAAWAQDDDDALLAAHTAASTPFPSARNTDDVAKAWGITPNHPCYYATNGLRVKTLPNAYAKVILDKIPKFLTNEPNAAWRRRDKEALCPGWLPSPLTLVDEVPQKVVALTAPLSSRTQVYNLCKALFGGEDREERLCTTVHVNALSTTTQGRIPSSILEERLFRVLPIHSVSAFPTVDAAVVLKRWLRSLE